MAVKHRQPRVYKRKVANGHQYFIKEDGKFVPVDDKRSDTEKHLYKLSKLLISKLIPMKVSERTKKRRHSQKKKLVKKLKLHPGIVTYSTGANLDVEDAKKKINDQKREERLKELLDVQKKLLESNGKILSNAEIARLSKALKIDFANAHLPRLMPPPPPPRVVPATPGTPKPPPTPIVPILPATPPLPVTPSTGPIPRKKKPSPKDEDDDEKVWATKGEVKKKLKEHDETKARADDLQFEKLRGKFEKAIGKSRDMKKKLFEAIGELPDQTNVLGRKNDRKLEDWFKAVNANGSYKEKFCDFILHQFDEKNPLPSIGGKLIADLNIINVGLRDIDAELDETVEEPKEEPKEELGEFGLGKKVRGDGLYSTQIDEIVKELDLPGYLGTIAADEIPSLIGVWDEKIKSGDLAPDN